MNEAAFAPQDAAALLRCLFARALAQTRRADSASMAEALGAAGYATGMSGKWHVTHNLGTPRERIEPEERTNWPLDRGFESFYGTVHGAGSFFDPVTLAEGEMDVDVVGVEIIPGTAEEAWWLERTFSGVETRMLVTGSGEVLREESALGLQSVRMSREEAQDVPTTDGPVDLIAQTAVRVEGAIPNARQTTRLTLELRGAAGSRVPAFPPFQVRAEDQVTLRKPTVNELRAGTAISVDLDAHPEMEAWVTHTPTIASAHPEMMTKAAELVASAPDRLTAVQEIAQFVDTYVEDVPVVGVPNGLDVLRRGQGDCNEHTALFVSLARAVKIPARIAAGVVYSDRVPGTAGMGAFYYHAWPEVQMAPSEPWIAIDPTFGQFPADATHVKLVQGDLDRQIEIMSYMGRLGFKIVSSGTGTNEP